MVQQQVETSKDFDIVYDRSGRCYNVSRVDGDVVITFPAKQKGDAVRFALSLFHPELAARAARMAARSPLLERVAWAGAELAASGAVEIMSSEQVLETGVMAMVDSSDGMGRYALGTEPVNGNELHRVVTCNCGHYTSGAAPVSLSGNNRVCKHIAAYWFTRNTIEAN